MIRGAIVFIALLAPATATAQTTPPLTLKQAEQTALENNPQIRAVQYGALAADEIVREARSAYFPIVYGSLTGAGAQSGSRIAAGGLNNPVIYNRFATGFSVSQLLTDFGRTHALVESSSLNAKAQEQSVTTRKADVLLNVDRAYYNVLRTQAVARVAQQTVAARQLVVDQVSALAASNLKSSLDVSFAKVNLGEAQLLLVQAQNDVKSAFAELGAALGSQDAREYVLSDEPLPGPPPGDEAALIAQAFRDRPELANERFSVEAATKLATAERSLMLPSVGVVGSFGSVPYRDFGLNDRYSAIGINVNVPLTNGNLFLARRAEATYRAEQQTQRMHDVENQIARDVRTALLSANTAYQRLSLTDQLLAQAKQALDLAQARYNLGLSSIVELTQAQLNETQAEIAQASARFDYQASTAAVKYETGSLR